MTFFSGNSGVRTTESSRNLERAIGIEPIAGSRSINQIKLIRLPLHHRYTLVLAHYQRVLRPSCAQIL
jgi:hypothetical protein